MDPRDQTFMTIHNLTPDANILFTSDSIFDILGYQPHEVQGKSCFDYFHPQEVPFARSVHSRGVLLDKAAVLHYARILSRDGRWVSCECCFTVVHDVLVACTSIYLRGEKSERRALEAPQIRRIFSCSPRDPRYHMLEHLSPKFKMPPMEREPRAALILNRFTRNLSIMFATNAVTTILGLRPDEIKDKSFYECIQENCLQDAIQCLESAKANESIAYLRFWFRDPRVEDHEEQAHRLEEDEDDDEDEQTCCNTCHTSDSEGGGAQLDGDKDMDMDGANFEIDGQGDYDMQDARRLPSSSNAGSLPSSGAATTDYSSHLSTQATQTRPNAVSARPSRTARSHEPPATFELEAVVSCTSDGLVVVLRKARPAIPQLHPPMVQPLNYENGMFAAPWGQSPIQPYFPPELLYTFRPPLLPQYMPVRESVIAQGGLPTDQMMRSIQDVAVFAWAVVGINGNLAMYSRGSPRGGAQPVDGLPIWDPSAGNTGYLGPENQAIRRWEQGDDGKSHAGHGLPYRHNSHLYPPAEPPPQVCDQMPPPPLDGYSSYRSAPTWSRPNPPLTTGSYEQAYFQPRRDQFIHNPTLMHPLHPDGRGREQPERELPQLHPRLPPLTQPSRPVSTSFQLPREPWENASAAQAYDIPDPIPTTQPLSRSGSNNGSPYLWQ